MRWRLACAGLLLGCQALRAGADHGCRAEAARRAGLTFPTASKGMSLRAGLGIACELTGKRRNRVFVYDRYVEMLAEGDRGRRERGLIIAIGSLVSKRF